MNELALLVLVLAVALLGTLAGYMLRPRRIWPYCLMALALAGGIQFGMPPDSVLLMAGIGFLAAILGNQAHNRTVGRTGRRSEH